MKPEGLFFLRVCSEEAHWRPKDRRIPDERGMTRIEKRNSGTVMVHLYTLDELKLLGADNHLKIISANDCNYGGSKGMWNVIFRKI